MFTCSCFFFMQDTAYELRISDWSSDVCSSDLIRNSALFRLPSSAALSSARVTLMGIRLPTPYLPPVQPVLTSQHVTPPLAIRSFSRLPSIDGWRGMNGPPTQAEKVASGSVTPISVPATLAVSPERKRSDSQRLGKEGDRT